MTARLIWIFLACSLAIAAGSWLFYQHQVEEVRKRARQELDAIADLKLAQIVSWRRERIGDATVISENPLNSVRIVPFLERAAPGDAGQDIRSWLEVFRRINLYRDIVLLDGHGRVRLSARGGEPEVSTSDRKVIEEAIRAGRPTFGDFHRSGEDPRIHLAVYSPIPGPAGSGPGASTPILVLEIDPGEFLFPLIQTWPTASLTAETLLIRRDGDDVLFLNDLRHRKNTALVHRAPISTPELPAAMAMRGQKGTVDGIDYRGERVLATIRPVPGTGWALVAKQDHREIMAHFQMEATILGGLAAASIVAVGLVLLLWWKRREAGFYRRQYELEQENRRTLDALRRSEEQMRLLLDSTAEAIFGLDLDGRCTFCNPACVALLHRGGADELIGRSMEAHIHRSCHDTAAAPARECPIGRALRTGERVHADDELFFRADGSGFPVEYWSHPQRMNGSVVGAVVTFFDITDRKRAEDELRRRNSELEMSNSDLDDFAHTVAHDLKDPLSTIIGHSVFLAEKSETLSPERQLNAARTILRLGWKMDNIIQELLLLAEVRKSEPPRRVVRMADVVAAARERLADTISTTSAEIVEPPQWPITLGYGPWLEEVWANYLSNAIKYGGRPPRVELSAARQIDGSVLFTVKDNGLGISPEHQASLFVPFARVGNVRSRGHGLGLSIVRRIVERLGGTVGVSSEVGLGASFTFTLPGLDSREVAAG